MCEPTCTEAFDPGASGSMLTHADTALLSRNSGHFLDFPWPRSPWLAHGSPLHGDQFSDPMGLLHGASCAPSTVLACSARIALRPPIPVRLILFLPRPLRLASQRLLFPSLIACLYPTGPPATPRRGPTGSSSA